MFEMAKAWDKGISPYEFRKCYMSDLNFIFEFEKAKKELIDKKRHEEKIKNVINQIKMR